MNLSEHFPPYPLSSNQTLPELVLCHLPSWGAITLYGEDKKSYLQGQVTCDVVSLENNQSTLGAHCDAKGKMLSAFRLFHHRGGYALFQAQSAIEKELSEIKKYAIFSKVTIEKSHEIFLGVLGSQANSTIEKLTGQTVATSINQVISFELGTAVQISAQRWLIMLNAEQLSTLLDQCQGAILSDEALWDYADVMEGLPRVNQHEQLEHIPQAMNLQALGGISFTKGCYTGQETIARAKYRGINKRALFRLKGTLSSQLTEDLSIERQVGENWRSAGQINCYYHFNDNTLLALAVLPNNLETDTAFRLTAFPETILHFDPLPYSLEE
ncbi:tRNA-modifying protein YgfZ [Vibrio aphrogenes]|uniref:tRNA-modifying protein YgfZ n=1 Tax=Vibrio aphrogenes TaxID=1891186 RepID=UPI000B357A1D|nr:tRNA-modifying protein YgfZ [Vibrio aphrogenes]